MALPGGRVDSSDASLLAAVKREVREEVSVDLECAILLDTQQELPVPPINSKFEVTPFVFLLTEEPSIKIQISEVQSVHWLSLFELEANVGRGQFQYKYGDVYWNLPKIDVDGHMVWGMTLKVLDKVVGAKLFSR